MVRSKRLAKRTMDGYEMIYNEFLFIGRGATLVLIAAAIVAIMSEDTGEECMWHILMMSLAICVGVLVCKIAGRI